MVSCENDSNCYAEDCQYCKSNKQCIKFNFRHCSNNACGHGDGNCVQKSAFQEDNCGPGFVCGNENFLELHPKLAHCHAFMIHMNACVQSNESNTIITAKMITLAEIGIKIVVRVFLLIKITALFSFSNNKHF